MEVSLKLLVAFKDSVNGDESWFYKLDTEWKKGKRRTTENRMAKQLIRSEKHTDSLFPHSRY